MAKGKFEFWKSEDGLLLLTAWARDGLTDEQIAKNIGIGRGTLYQWKNKFSDISDALKKGKEPVDIEVENALLKRALGYEYAEVKEEYEHGEPVRKTVLRKYSHPDVTAQIFWLKNRKPAEWREKQENKAEKDNGMLSKLIDGLRDTDEGRRKADLQQ